MADGAEEPENQKSTTGRKSLPAQIRSAANDVRNDTIVTSANLYLVARRVLLTSLGAIALTIEETNEFIDKLVERGELAEHELSHLVEDFTARNRKADALALSDKSDNASKDARSSTPNQLPDTSAPALVVCDDKPATVKSSHREGNRLATFPVGVLADRVEVILDRLNVPTRSDIEALSAKIGRLSDKVAQMKSRAAAPQDPARTNGVHDEVIDIVAEGKGTTSRHK